MRSRRTLLPDLCLLWLIWQFFVATTGFCVVGMVLAGCDQPSVKHQISSLRTSGAMDVGQDWRRTAEVTDSKGDTFYRFDCPELNEHRWFVRRAGSLSTLPYDGEVPK